MVTAAFITTEDSRQNEPIQPRKISSHTQLAACPGEIITSVDYIQRVLFLGGRLDHLSPLRPLPGGRRLAAAPTGASDCAGFAPNQTQLRLALTALSLTPCHPPSASVLSLRRCRLVFPRCRSGERKNKPTPAEG